MKRLALAAALLVSAAPVGAQDSEISTAVAETVIQHVQRRGVTPEERAAAMEAVRERVEAAEAAQNNQSWLEWFQNADFLWPFSLAWSTPSNDGRWTGNYYEKLQGGASGTGGASETFDYDPLTPFDCEDFVYSLAPDGRLIVPAVPIPTGEQHSPRPDGEGPVTTWYVSCTTLGSCASGVWQSSPMHAAVRYSLHLANMKRGDDPRDWFGVWRVDSTNKVWIACQYYLDGSGATKGCSSPASGSTTPTGNLNYRSFSYAPEVNKPCPPAAVGASDYHFYSYATSASADFATCAWYHPNGSISSNGYAYPDTVSIYANQVDQYLLAFPSLAQCPINPEVIRRIADHLFKEATEQPGYDGPPYEEITSEDVRTGGTDPKVVDLIEDPETLPEPTGNGPPPSSQPTTPSTPPSSSPDYSHPGTAANDPTAPEIDWWPDLPSIEVDLGSPTCPTYDLTMPQWSETFVVDSHCQLIEDNAAIISTLMIVLFTIGSVFIVLRA